MTRLLQILPVGTIIGGAERYALTIGAEAAAVGWEINAAFPHTAESVDLVNAFGEAGVSTHALDGRTDGALGEVATTARRTAKLVARVRPDVVHLTLPFPTFGRGHLIGCALRGVPTVVVFQLVPDGFDVGRSGRLYPALRTRGQVWVAVSEHARRALGRSFRVRTEEVAVIRNGVETVPTGPPSLAERVEVRRSLGLPDAAFIALSVGRLSKQKGHVDIISAAVAAAEQFRQVHFVIAGEGEERGELEDLIRRNRLAATVHLVGHQSEVDRLVAVADLFLFPSRLEGFPFALMEAMAHGLPVVSAAFSGLHELVADRHSGLVYQPGDTASLWKAVEFAIEHPAEMRIMGGRAKEVADNFSRDNMVKSTLELLAAAAARRVKRAC